MEEFSQLERVLMLFKLYTERLLEIQLQKAKVATGPFNAEEWEKLSQMVLGTYRQWQPSSHLDNQSELELAATVEETLAHFLPQKNRLLRHVYTLFYRRMRFNALTEREVEAYQRIREVHHLQPEIAQHFSAEIWSLERRGLLIRRGAILFDTPLPPDENSRKLVYFLDLLNLFKVLKDALKGGFFRTSLLSLLQDEAKSLDPHLGDYRLFLKLYEEERAICYKAFDAIREQLTDDLKIAHALEPHFIASVRSLTLNPAVSFLFISFIYLKVHLLEAIGGNYDVLLHTKTPRGRYLRTAVSGLSEQYPDAHAPITGQEKERLHEISSAILAHPQDYFLPKTSNVPYSFVGNTLRFPSAYADRFCGKTNRSNELVYATYTAGGSNKAVILLAPKHTSIGVHHKIAEALKMQGISSISLVLPEHERRRQSTPLNADAKLHLRIYDQNALESQDPVFSGSIYGTIEQIIQGTNDIILAINWLEQKGYKSFGIYAQSSATVFPHFLLALDPRITLAAFIIPGIEGAEAVWVSASVTYVREMYEAAGIKESELRDYWKCFAAPQYLRMVPEWKRSSAKIYVALATKDMTYPIEMQEKIVPLIKGTFLHATFEEFSLAHSPLVMKFLLQPERIVRYIKENLGVPSVGERGAAGRRTMPSFAYGRERP